MDQKFKKECLDNCHKILPDFPNNSKQFKVKPLTGGLTNLIYLISYQSTEKIDGKITYKKLLYRKFGPGKSGNFEKINHSCRMIDHVIVVMPFLIVKKKKMMPICERSEQIFFCWNLLVTCLLMPICERSEKIFFLESNWNLSIDANLRTKQTFFCWWDSINLLDDAENTNKLTLLELYFIYYLASQNSTFNSYIISIMASCLPSQHHIAIMTSLILLN